MSEQKQKRLTDEQIMVLRDAVLFPFRKVSAETLNAIFDALGEIHSLREQLRWRSVSEETPEQDGYSGHVFVARDVPFDPGFGDRDVTMAFLDKSSWRDDRGSVESDGEKVTHWMPLHDPPPKQDCSDVSMWGGANDPSKISPRELGSLLKFYFRGQVGHDEL